MQYVSLNARFSPCLQYRYSLERTWAGGKGRVLFVGLNPSKACRTTDDPTIRRCVGFAKYWGFNSMEIVNLFAFRTTYPTDLKMAANPIGSLNDLWINDAQKRSDKTIICWGSIGRLSYRASDVLKQLEDPYCLKINKTLEPAHPLYLQKNLRPFLFNPQK